MKAAITIINDAGGQTCFHELILAIGDSLLELGYQWRSYFGADEYKLSDVNIFVKGDRIEELDEKKINILVQTEQVDNRRPRINHIKKLPWTRILEFFPDQINRPNEVYFPLGYSSFFDTERREYEQKYDYLFFGNPTPDRRAFCKFHHIPCRRGLWGTDRDKVIMETKLNLHIKPNQKPYYFPPLHGMLILCKGKVLLHQKVDGIQSQYTKFTIPFDPVDFKQVASTWLQNDNKRKEYGNSIRKKLMNHHNFNTNFISCVRGIL